MKLLNLAIYVSHSMGACQELLILHFLVFFIISLLKCYLRNVEITASARGEFIFLNISKSSVQFLVMLSELHPCLRQQLFVL
jgi:hypothetical protein